MLRSLSVQIMVVDHPIPASIWWHAASLTLHVEKMLITTSGTEGFDPLTWLTQLWLQCRKITAVARAICILYKYVDPGDRSTWMLFQGTGIWKAYPCRVSLILSLLRNYHSRISIIFHSHFDFSEIFDVFLHGYLLICIRTSVLSPSPEKSCALIN